MRPEIAGFRLSIHAEALIKERELELAWIEDTISHPETTLLGEDGNLHYIKTIQGLGNRKLRVVVNNHVSPNKIVTIFFDRRLKGKQ